MGFDFKALTDYQKNLMDLVSKEFPKLKRNTLTRMTYKLQSHIVQFVPRDTGLLAGSIVPNIKDEDTGVVGTDVEYAQAANDGHMQHKRFLPAKYLDNVKGRTYIGNDNNKGIMLKEKFIPGAHFIEKGLQRADKDIDIEANKLFDKIEKIIG